MSIDLGHIAGAIPEIFILLMITTAILAELFFAKCLKHITYAVVQLALVGAFILTIFQLGQDRSFAFTGLFVADDLAVLLKLFIMLAAFFGFFYSKQYVEDKKMASGEFYILGLFSVLGMMVLTSAHSLLTVYLGLELMSLPLYALIALSFDPLIH